MEMFLKTGKEKRTEMRKLENLGCSVPSLGPRAVLGKKRGPITGAGPIMGFLCGDIPEFGNEKKDGNKKCGPGAPVSIT